ncbi:hypothetical protein DICPUDRAFT_158748 [Dictyostelium purpureum]|uniref:Uncharacterized protein n=1 Tax=Dictyostelium purpureum TaxID=5786 RepID=F1A2D7_DICPU|nr:uncharacterized protein DICPUDRAFT_158748 [Dictyostelium purpureum]EGC29645.1 hypothetical protein DICPUDRAFT_158748 [Dictyostelium purpureum]|eukprot:XP_003293832.1 hypothetical protein DICPUDRAFT_158748 [Dictyostelium purpureum]
MNNNKNNPNNIVSNINNHIHNNNRNNSSNKYTNESLESYYNEMEINSNSNGLNTTTATKPISLASSSPTLPGQKKNNSFNSFNSSIGRGNNFDNNSIYRNYHNHNNYNNYNKYSYNNNDDDDENIPSHNFDNTRQSNGKNNMNNVNSDANMNEMDDGNMPQTKDQILLIAGKKQFRANNRWIETFSLNEIKSELIRRSLRSKIEAVVPQIQYFRENHYNSNDSYHQYEKKKLMRILKNDIKEKLYRHEVAMQCYDCDLCREMLNLNEYPSQGDNSSDAWFKRVLLISEFAFDQQRRFIDNLIQQFIHHYPSSNSLSQQRNQSLMQEDRAKDFISKANGIKKFIQISSFIKFIEIHKNQLKLFLILKNDDNYTSNPNHWKNVVSKIILRTTKIFFVLPIGKEFYFSYTNDYLYQKDYTYSNNSLFQQIDFNYKNRNNKENTYSQDKIQNFSPVNNINNNSNKNNPNMNNSNNINNNNNNNNNIIII